MDPGLRREPQLLYATSGLSAATGAAVPFACRRFFAAAVFCFFYSG